MLLLVACWCHSCLMRRCFRLCIVGIQSESVRTYLSSVAGPFLWSSATHTWHVCLSDTQVSPFAYIWISSSPTFFFFCLWLVIRTYILPGFFSVIYWPYLRTEIAVTLSIGNKLYSRHHILYFSFLWKPLCWCYLVTALIQCQKTVLFQIIQFNIKTQFKCKFGFSLA